jgi:general stress protein 26
VWLATGLETGKVDQIEENPKVGVVAQSPTAYVSISGTAELHRDRKLIDELWQESWKVWFPEGKSDPNLALIAVRLERAEYWDHRGTKSLRFLWEATKAYVQGTTPKTTEEEHGVITQSVARPSAPSANGRSASR